MKRQLSNALIGVGGGAAVGLIVYMFSTLPKGDAGVLTCVLLCVVFPLLAIAMKVGR